MGVLLESGRSGKGLAALGTSVSPGADVRRADVPLEIGRVGEHLGAVLAGIPSA